MNSDWWCICHKHRCVLRYHLLIACSSESFERMGGVSGVSTRLQTVLVSSYTTFIDKHWSVYHYLMSSALSGFSQLPVPSGGCTLWWLCPGPGRYSSTSTCPAPDSQPLTPTVARRWNCLSDCLTLVKIEMSAFALKHSNPNKHLYLHVCQQQLTELYRQLYRSISRSDGDLLVDG